MVAAFQGKRRQTESLAHSRGLEEETRRIQEQKIVLGLPSWKSHLDMPSGSQAGSSAFRIQTLVTSPHIPYKCCTSRSRMMEVGSG